MTKKVVTLHATRMEDLDSFLCPSMTGRAAKPGEIVNCPECRVAINHVKRNYSEFYANTTMTKEQKREAARDMYRDLVLGEIEG